MHTFVERMQIFHRSDDTYVWKDARTYFVVDAQYINRKQTGGGVVGAPPLSSFFALALSFLTLST